MYQRQYKKLSSAQRTTRCRRYDGKGTHKQLHTVIDTFGGTTQAPTVEVTVVTIHDIQQREATSATQTRTAWEYSGGSHIKQQRRVIGRYRDTRKIDSSILCHWPLDGDATTHSTRLSFYKKETASRCCEAHTLLFLLRNEMGASVIIDQAGSDA